MVRLDLLLKATSKAVNSDGPIPGWAKSVASLA